MRPALELEGPYMRVKLRETTEWFQDTQWVQDIQFFTHFSQSKWNLDDTLYSNTYCWFLFLRRNYYYQVVWLNQIVSTGNEGQDCIIK